MLETVNVTQRAIEVKSATPLAKAEWQNKQYYRVVVVNEYHQEISRIMSEHEYKMLLATMQFNVIKVLDKFGRIVD